MKAVGITSEYNPLHNGHVYHMHEARALSDADAVVVALSGDFVQRGMPSVMDKWSRAKHALMCGADLVIEIPVLHCLGNAGQYASASVKLLEALGAVKHIAFGSETGDAAALMRTASFLNENAERLEEEIKCHAKQGVNYPLLRAAAFEKLGGGEEGLRILSNPNDILAVEYIRNMESAEAIAVKRLGAGYTQSENRELVFQSASGIREILRNGGDISDYVPECVRNDLVIEASSVTLCEKNARLFDMIRFAVMAASPEMIDDCPSGGEGLGNLLRSEVKAANSLDQLIMQVKSRRYTYTRISRLLMQVLLGITRTIYYTGADSACPDPGYIRILGFNDTGRKLLAEIKNRELNCMPIITNINKEKSLISRSSADMLGLDTYAADIYSLMTGREIAANNDHIQRPVYMKHGFS